jgi:hypothetical protein
MKPRPPDRATILPIAGAADCGVRAIRFARMIRAGIGPAMHCGGAAAGVR